MYDIIMFNKDSFIKLMHMAVSVRETRTIYKHINPQSRTTPNLATAITYLSCKHSTFLRHKIIHVLPNATVL